MTKDISDEDKALFRKTIGDVIPLKHQQDRAPTPKNQHTPLKRPIKINPPWEEDPPEHQPLNSKKPKPVNAQTTLSFARPGIQNNLLRKLRKGQIPIDIQLDLHGMTIDEVNNTLPRFIHDCKTHQHRLVRLIHGKGHNILKNHLNHYLRTHPDILAFHSTLPKHGGTGALYVLLKK